VVSSLAASNLVDCGSSAQFFLSQFPRPSRKEVLHGDEQVDFLLRVVFRSHRNRFVLCEVMSKRHARSDWCR